MTIISETRLGVTVKPEVIKPLAGDSIQTVIPSAPLKLSPPQPESTTLVRDFILSFNELENYK